jgi:hypothetical protein
MARPSSTIPQDTRKQRTKAHRRDADLLNKALEEMEAEEGFRKKNNMKTDEERRGAELISFFCWPFNVTHEGVWKVWSGMGEGELMAWKELGEEVRCAGFHVR